MKKKLALILVTVLMLALAIPAMAATRINITAPFGTPVLDGEKDSVYGDLVAVDAIHSFDEVTTTGATAKYAFAWDKDFLYVYVEVDDKTPNFDHADAHQRDSAEVFIDWFNTQADNFQDGVSAYWLVRFISDPNSEEGSGGVTGFKNDIGGGTPWNLAGAEEEIIRVSKPINGDYKNGYTIEAKIPVAPVEPCEDGTTMTFEEGRVIGMCFGVNDNQDGTQRNTGAYPANVEPDASWDSPVNHGYLLTLVAASAASAVEEPKEEPAAETKDEPAVETKDAPVVEEAPVAVQEAAPEATPAPVQSAPATGDMTIVFCLAAILGAAVVSFRIIKTKA